jgi:hypothetical protein
VTRSDLRIIAQCNIALAAGDHSWTVKLVTLSERAIGTNA